jgi:hypothetical protein
MQLKIASIYNFLQTYLIRIWTFCFLLVYVRIPLATSMEMYSLRRVLIILPVLLGAVYFAVAISRNRSLKTSALSKLWLFNLILCGLYAIYLVVAVNYHISFDLLPTLAPMILCSIPLLAIEQYDVETSGFVKLFEKVSIFVIWIGFFWFALQGLSRVDADRLSDFLLPLKAQLETYPNSTAFSHRRIGFLMRLEPSALAMMAGAIFLFGNMLQRKFESYGLKAFHALTVGVGLLGILYSSSLTMLAATVAMLAAMTFLILRKHRMKIVAVSAVGLLAVLVIFKSTLCSFLPRVIYYINNFQKYSARFYLKMDCNFQSFLMRFEPPGTLTNRCYANEVLFFDPVANYGLIPVLAWFVFAGLAVYLFVRVVRRHQRPLIPLAAFAFSFLIPAWHMSGVENWGNNYIFILAVFFLYQAKDQPQSVWSEANS